MIYFALALGKYRMKFSTYWDNADSISQTLYFILLAMSIATWVIFILRFLNTKAIKQEIQKNLEHSLQKVQIQLNKLPLTERKSVAEQALLRTMNAEKAKAEKGVAVLGTIASIAPFVGLFGTVWGIFHALVAIGESGQSGLAQVATPVGEALIMTGFGLAVAIPAVLGYNICTRLNRGLSAELQDKAHQLLLEVMLQQSITEQDSKSEKTEHAEKSNSKTQTKTAGSKA